MLAWAAWMETADRRVAHDSRGGVTVSTVFLGLDHSFGSGPPMLFETMVFHDGRTGVCCERYATWDDAVAGHKAMCAKVYPVGEKR